MTVNTTKITSGPYVGNGVASTFSYTFKVDDKTQLSVYETTDAGVETLLTVDTHYTVAGVGTDGGGILTRVAGALPTDYQWYIRSNYIETQLTAFGSQGPFFPEIHEFAMDKLTFLIQQLLDEKGRSPSVSNSYSGITPLSLDNPVAGLAVRWNGGGTGLENYDPSTVSNEEIAADKPTINYSTLSTALNDNSLKLNQACNIKEYATGEGGGALWDVYPVGTFPQSSYVKNHTLLSLQLVLRPSQKITDKMFGSHQTSPDSSTSFFDFLTFCWSNCVKGYMENEELDFADGISFQGGGSAASVTGSLVLEGKCKITLGANATIAGLTIQYVHTVDVSNLSVDGNKINQTTTIDGINFFWIDTLITKNVRSDNCYRHGIYLFKVKNLAWDLGGGSDNGGVDALGVVSNGIFAAPVGAGYIKGTKCHNNNPSTLQPGENDGNGVHLGLVGSDDDFWTAATDMRQLEVDGQDCVGNGRRGVKVQRSDSVVFNGYCSNNNSANILVIEDAELDNVKIYGNKIGSTGDLTANTIKLGSTAGGVVKEIHVFGNTFLGDPTAQAVDVDIDSDSVFIHSNIESWDAGLTTQRYIVRAGTTNINLSTDETVNNLAGSELKLIKPSEQYLTPESSIVQESGSAGFMKQFQKFVGRVSVGGAGDWHQVIELSELPVTAGTSVRFDLYFAERSGNFQFYTTIMLEGTTNLKAKEDISGNWSSSLYRINAGFLEVDNLPASNRDWTCSITATRCGLI